MKKNIFKRNLQSSAILIFFLACAAGSIDQDDSRPSRTTAAGNLVIKDAFRGTTFQQETHKNECIGKVFDFTGSVEDVTSSRNAQVMIDNENYADVEFIEDISRLQKGDTIYFSACLDNFGTGILINHQLSNARISK